MLDNVAFAIPVITERIKKTHTTRTLVSFDTDSTGTMTTTEAVTAAAAACMALATAATAWMDTACTAEAMAEVDTEVMVDTADTEAMVRSDE